MSVPQWCLYKTVEETGGVKPNSKSRFWFLGVVGFFLFVFFGRMLDTENVAVETLHDRFSKKNKLKKIEKI